MARCQITGKSKGTGNRVSHANNKTKRSFKPNVQKMRVVVDGKVKKMYVSTKALRWGLVTKAPRVKKYKSGGVNTVRHGPNRHLQFLIYTAPGSPGAVFYGTPASLSPLRSGLS